VEKEKEYDICVTNIDFYTLDKKKRKVLNVLKRKVLNLRKEIGEEKIKTFKFLLPAYPSSFLLLEGKDERKKTTVCGSKMIMPSLGILILSISLRYPHSVNPSYINTVFLVSNTFRDTDIIKL